MAANFFQPGFDEQVESQNIERQRKYAELLTQKSQQGMGDGRMVGRMFVPPSVTQGLAQLLQAYQGGQGAREADEKQLALAKAVRGRTSEEMGQFTNLLAGTPGELLPPDQAGPPKPGQAPDMRAAYSFAAGAQTPALQQVGLRGLAEMPQMEARRAEMQENREFKREEREAMAAQRAQQVKEAHALRMDAMAAQNASRADMMQAQQEFQREMKKLGSGAAAAQPYFQPVQTAQGVMAFNARTGRVEPVMGADGSPVVGAAADPRLQGALAGAKAGASTEAKAVVEARMEVPQTVAQGEEAVKLVDDLLKAPGLGQAVGASRMVGIQKIPGTAAKDFDVRLDQLKGKQFLQAFQSLKGGGAITEMEGNKATNAIARMDASGSEAEFKAAAREFQEIIKAGVERAKAKGGVATQAAPAAATAPAAAGQPRVIRFDAKGNRIP